jgi:hypothetical protein
LPLIFDSTFESVRLQTRYITAVDFSNDGSLLAVSHVPAAGAKCLSVYRTSDAALVGEYGVGAGRGAAFSGDGRRVYFLLQNEQGDYEFCAAELGRERPELVARYGGGEMLHALRRDLACRFVAVLGSAVELWDMGSRKVVRFKEPAAPYAAIQAHLSRDGSHLYVYGLRESEVVGLDVPSDTEFGSWPAPTQVGWQVVASPSEEYLVAVAAGQFGVFVYHVPSGTRFRPEVYNDDSFAKPFLFSHDGSLLITLVITLRGQPLPAGEVVAGPELMAGPPSAVASAWEAPLVAYAIEDRVFWVRLL